MNMPQRHRIKNLVLPLILANAVVLSLCAALYLGLASPIKSTNLDSESRRLELYENLVRGDVEGAIGDLRLLASGDGITEYLATGSPADLDRAMRRAEFVSKDNPDYDQIRYIDETGKEIFRVNWNGAVVPPGRLQDKSSRSYFQKANALSPGEIYLSKIDLNVEDGRVEQPLKPTLRLATPLVDATGRHRGIYIINYRAANIIDQLRKYISRRAGRLRVLNEQGYWLAGPTPESEWGFQLPERSANCLAKTDPALWAQIQANPTGQARYQGGYLTWERIQPRDFAPGKPFHLVSEDDYLVLASVISRQEWNESLASLRLTFLALALLLVGLTSFLMRSYLARRQAQLERDRFFNLSRDLLCIVGLDGYFLRVNPAWTTTLGYSAEELTGQPYLSFVHPEDRDKTSAEVRRLDAGGETDSFENRYRAKDGTYRWLLWSSRSVQADKTLYASARDLTERRQIEEKLRASEERLRLMLESLQDYAVYMLSTDGRIATWNSGAERIKGYKAEEIIGQHFSRFYPPEQIAGRFPELELKQADEKGRYEDEGWRVRKDGTSFWANVIITPMRNSQGELVGFVKVTRDVTARKEAGERIERLNEELRARAAALEGANQELESFSYSVSHDLRAPLRHIHGFVELLQHSPAFAGQEVAQRQMNVIAKAAREMGVLIDDLLTFSRTGRAEMRVAQVRMRDLVEQSIKSLEVETAGRRIVWNIAPLSPIAGDPGLLRQVWANLLGNAVKYTRPREEARIEVGQQASEAANGRSRVVTYYVRDNGVGFDMAYASKLFGVFQRLHRPEDFEGTGIGLANVQRIIHRHGGKIWAESQVDHGATFYFSLPMKAAVQIETYANG